MAQRDPNDKRSKRYGENTPIAKEPKERAVNRGVPKGRVSQKTLDVRDFLKNFVAENAQDFADTYQRLEDRDKVEVFIKVCKFVVPTIQNIQFEDKTAQDGGNWKDKLKALASGRVVEDAEVVEEKKVEDDGFRKEEILK